MNWSRVKTILIILFLLTDIFLLVSLVLSMHNSTTITPEIIESTVEILKKQDIVIDKELIPSKVTPAPYAEADNVIDDYEAFAKKFLGNVITKTGDNSYESTVGIMSFDGDRFGFSKKNPENGKAIDEKSAQANVISYLTAKGFDLSNADVSTTKNSNGFTVTLKNLANSLPLFNSVITAQVSGDVVTSVTGIWFNQINVRGQANELKTVTSALIDFIPATAAVPTEIVGLTLGYTVPESNVYHKSAVLIPVWEIQEANGNKHYPDARNPER